jgi:hypothetical protein
VERFGETSFCTLSLLPPQIISKPHNPTTQSASIF